MHKLSRVWILAVGIATSYAAADPAFDRFVDDFAAEWVRADPTLSTTSQYFSGAEQDALDRQLTPNTAAGRAQRVERARRGLAGLARFDRAALSATQQVSAATIAWQLEEVIRSEPYAAFEFVFHQFRGLQVQLVNFLSQTHPIRNRRDIENYLARLALVAPQLDEGIAQAKQRAERGILPPRFILTSTLGQLDVFLQGEPAQNVLVVSLTERAAKLADVTADQRTAFAQAAEKIVAAEIVPAFRRVRAMLEQQRERATDDAGLWRLREGDKAYAAALRSNTTTTMSAGEIHQLGLKEVARIEAAMDAILRSLGYAEGTVNARYTALEAKLQPTGPDPRGTLLARYTELVRDAERRAENLFDIRPRARCEVRREPAFTERTAAAHYSIPSRDGTRPGVFWVPLPDSPYRIVSMRSLTYHEAVPGHHFQLALQAELQDLPRFRSARIFGGLPAHSEGWALYAERLAAENNWYEGDQIGALGQLDSELFRARRLVVDTGLHAQKWTRQQAIDYGIKVSEVERYVVNPGQACAYKVGELRILAAREKARQALGARFSLKEFHNLILLTGNVPLDVLDDVVDRWIRMQSRS